jgi:hypothetical protein
MKETVITDSEIDEITAFFKANFEKMDQAFRGLGRTTMRKVRKRQKFNPAINS